MPLNLEKAKVQIAVRPVDGNGTSPTSYVFDINGCKAVHLFILCGICATPPTALKVLESDTWSSATALGGTPAVVPLADFSVSPLTLAGATGTGLVSAVTIPCIGVRQRYLRLTLTAASAVSLVGALWVGEDLDEAANTAAKRGLAQYSVVVG